MKKFLPLMLLGLLAGGCSTAPADKATIAPAVDPTHAKVEAYLKKTLDDPRSYEPAHWSKIEVFRQQDADKILVANQEAEFESQIGYGRAETSAMRMNTAMGGSEADFKRHSKAAQIFAHRADSVQKVIERMRHSTDTTRLGSVVTHSFRAKNKMGALVLDSARFVVYNDGKVVALSSEK